MQFSCPIHEEKTNSQLHAQKVKSRLDYIGKHQFVLTLTICHTSGEKMAISMSSTSFALAQLSQHQCLHLFPPPVRPPAHTGSSSPVSFCTAAVFLSTHLTHAPEPSNQIPSTSCPSLGQKCPFSSKERP